MEDQRLEQNDQQLNEHQQQLEQQEPQILAFLFYAFARRVEQGIAGSILCSWHHLSMRGSEGQ